MKTGWMVVFVFMLRSFSCVRRKSAEAWSLNGRTIRTGSALLLSVSEGTGCSDALMAMKRVMVELIRSFGYSRRKNNNLRRSHSSEKQVQLEESRNARSSIVFSFEKAYWKLEPNLSEDLRDLTASTLRSLALNYIHRKGPKPPKTLLIVIHQLKKRDNIVITKPDKGSGVVVMDKDEQLRLLAEASINDLTN